jgi:pimeloyl-ACP methyl ester carboxylesterase
MDRRGRGESGDGEGYSLDLEYDDVVAVVGAAGDGVSLLGHSYGAMVALEAALRCNLKALVLYEPGFPVEGVPLYPAGAKEELQELLDKGDRDGLLVTFFREVVGAPDEQIAALRADSSWPSRIRSAHTVLREFADGDYEFDPARFSALETPTLLLIGEDSPESLTKPSHLLAAALPNARTVVMPGQAHIAMTTAPDLFLREVLGFLTAVAPAGSGARS